MVILDDSNIVVEKKAKINTIAKLFRIKLSFLFILNKKYVNKRTQKRNHIERYVGFKSLKGKEVTRSLNGKL